MSFENPHSHSGDSSDKATELNTNMPDREFFDRYNEIEAARTRANPHEESGKSRTEYMVDTMSDQEVFGSAMKELKESDAKEAEDKRRAEIDHMAATMSDEEVFGTASRELAESDAKEAIEEAQRKAQIEHMIDTMTDREILDLVKAKIDREEAQENAESREVSQEAPVIEIAGKRLQVDAYTETWRDSARKYREEPRAVETQMIQISHNLELLTMQVQQVTDRMKRLRESNAEGGSVLNAEQEAQITEKLLAFQPLHEYNAIFTNAEQTLEEVKKILIDSERKNGMESARNIVSTNSDSHEDI